jgi:hypothetical protein
MHLRIFYILLFFLPFQAFARESPLEIYKSHIQKNLSDYEPKFEYLTDARKQEILDLCVKIRIRELENVDQYQVVTAQDSLFFAYQVIAKTLHAALHGEGCQDFEFLRCPHHTLISNPEDLFAEYPALSKMEENGITSDLQPDISRHLISCSLALETSTPADSALFVFLFGKGISEWSSTREEDAYSKKFERHLEELFECMGLARDSYAPFLSLLISAAPRTEEGIINQIFLPKENIQSHLYFAKSGGFFHPKQNRDVHETIKQFHHERLTSNLDMKKNLQARILTGSLSNRGVKIYRYTLIPEQEQEAYKNLVDQVIQKILISPSIDK